MPISAVPSGPSGPVAEMSLLDRFVEVLKRTQPRLPAAMQKEFSELLTERNLLIMAGALAAWAGSHYLGVGFIMDAFLAVAGFALLGLQLLQVAVYYFKALILTVRAKNDADLDAAADNLAECIAVIGVAVFSALVIKGAKNLAPKVRGAIAGWAAKGTGGITPTHYRIFGMVAQETGQIIAVRSTNIRSTAWIERGFPPKPMTIPIKTSGETGIVTVGILKSFAEEAALAREVGYFVVDTDGVPRNLAGETFRFKAPPEWPVQPGQVIDPKLGKPLVGDYDLLGVIDPKAPGRNIALAASDGKVLKDWSNPIIRRIAQALNMRMDMPRIMHGANDGKFGLPDKGGAVVFFPDAPPLHLEDADEVAEFYRTLGRLAITAPTEE